MVVKEKGAKAIQWHRCGRIDRCGRGCQIELDSKEKAIGGDSDEGEKETLPTAVRFRLQFSSVETLDVLSKEARNNEAERPGSK